MVWRGNPWTICTLEICTGMIGNSAHSQACLIEGIILGEDKEGSVSTANSANHFSAIVLCCARIHEHVHNKLQFRYFLLILTAL